MYIKLFLLFKYVFVEYKKNIFFHFYFLAQIQGAPKSNIKKKVDAWPTVYLWIGKSESKKLNGFLKRKVAYVTIYHI